jgi:hypothetical protein
MEASRKLFPSGYKWSAMRATADVLASVQQKLVFYVSETGSKRIQEIDAVRSYEAQLIEILESLVVSRNFTRSEAIEASEMLAEYESVQSEKCKAILETLSSMK